jgi:hypothetical protein
MFISNSEKSIINARIEMLEAKVNSLTALLTLAPAKTPEATSHKARKWSAESRAAQSASMKKYWAAKKASKVAA